MARPRHGSRGAIALVLVGVCIASFPHLQGFSIPKFVRQGAQSAKKTPYEFLKTIQRQADEWQSTTEIAGRSEFKNYIATEVMSQSGLHMVIGGKSLGKSKMIKNITASFDEGAPVIYVNMRRTASTDALRCVQEEAKNKWMNKNPSWARIRIGARTALQETAKFDVTQTFGLEGVVKNLPGFQNLPGFLAGATAFSIAELLKLPDPNEFFTNFVGEASSRGQIPVIIVDEANRAFPNGNGNGATNGNGTSNVMKEAAKTAIDAFLAESKEDRKACVILVSSEYSFPFRLETLGFNKYDSLSIVLAPEVEEEAMIKVLTEKWGMPQDLAEAFYEAFGGDIFLCDQALAKLVMRFSMGKEDLFDPYGIRDNFGLGGLVMDSRTRPHMENLARQGWSPVLEGSADSKAAARIIAKKNFGAVIGRKTETFNLPFEGEIFTDRNTEQVLIPTTQYMRKCIQVAIEAVRQKSWWRRILRWCGFK